MESVHYASMPENLEFRVFDTFENIQNLLHLGEFLFTAFHCLQNVNSFEYAENNRVPLFE